MLSVICLLEQRPISSEDALKYVFKLPKEGKFTAEFDDDTKTTIVVKPDNKSAGKYAFVGKKNGHIFKTWENKPEKQ